MIKYQRKQSARVYNVQNVKLYHLECFYLLLPDKNIVIKECVLERSAGCRDSHLHFTPKRRVFPTKVEWLLHKSGPKIKIKESDDNSTSSTLVSSGGWRGGEVGEKNSICIFVPPTPTPSCKHSRDTDASLAFRPLLFMCYVVVCR